jgi:RalA-binding protein 1
MEFAAVTEMSAAGAPPSEKAEQEERIKEIKVRELGRLVQRLPQANATLLKYLIAFLIKIINNSDVNKMTVRNVGIVFSPTLNIPAPVFAMFLQNYEGIFGIEPEEYELPSPTTETSSQPPQSRDGPPPRPSFDRPPRPSTSGGASPHRQRLMDSVMGQQRSGGGSGTPPLLMDLNQMRQNPTPTPPPTYAVPAAPGPRQTTYEPNFYSQQQQQPPQQPPPQVMPMGAGSHLSLRPAYESGFVLPPGFDPTRFDPSPPSRASPGYDRPIYQSSAAAQEEYGAGQGVAAYDQPYGRRRESAVFMGGMVGLNQKPSQSRLRDDTRL